MLELKSIGYLEYQEVKKGRDISSDFLKEVQNLLWQNTVDAPDIVRKKLLWM